MAGPPLISQKASLEAIRDEWLDAKTRVEDTPFEKDYAPQFADATHRCEALQLEERALRDGITVAAARVRKADDVLDDLVDEIEPVVRRAAGGDRTSARYTAFFKQAPSALKRPVLGPELETIRAWEPELEACPEVGLKQAAPRVGQAVARADTAVEQLTKSAASLRAFRLTGNRKTYIDACNASRARIVGEWADAIHKHPEWNLDAGFATQFFRRMHRVAKQTLESIDEQIESLAKELQDLQASRAQMAAHAEVEKPAKERLVESLAALAELQKHVDELKKEAGDG
jgi:hypothetical protein